MYITLPLVPSLGIYFPFSGELFDCSDYYAEFITQIKTFLSISPSPSLTFSSALCSLPSALCPLRPLRSNLNIQPLPGLFVLILCLLPRISSGAIQVAPLPGFCSILCSDIRTSCYQCSAYHIVSWPDQNRSHLYHLGGP